MYFSQFSHTYTYIFIHYIYLDTHNNITYISYVFLCLYVYIAHTGIPELREILTHNLQIHTFSLLHCAHLCKKYSLGISNFLEEISSISHSIVFLYCFALITEEGCLISPYYSLQLFIQMGICFLSPLPFTSLLFTSICKGSSDNYFAFLHLFFLGMVLITASCIML